MAFALRYHTSLADNIYTALCAHAYPHTFHLYTWSCCAHTRYVSEYTCMTLLKDWKAVQWR